MRHAIALFFSLFLFSSSYSHAGYNEIDLTGSFKRNTIAENDYSTNTSLTASIAYYFWQNSAVEFSYTKGQALRVVPPSGSLPKYTIRSDYTLMGMDLVLAWGDRESVFRPYVKAGALQIEKIQTLEPDGYDSSTIKVDPKIVPSAGVGLKIAVSKTFAIKLGAESWPANPDADPVIWDYAVRFGISWFIL